jgi:hypothetical protein
MSGIIDRIKSFFVQAHDLEPSQSMKTSLDYRARAPAIGTQSGPKPVIPDSDLPNSQFTMAYYKRNDHLFSVDLYCLLCVGVLHF